MHIDLIWVGRQDKQYANLVNLYADRLKYFAAYQFHEIEVRGVRDEKSRNRVENEKLLDLISKLGKNRFIDFWACDLSGRQFSSEEFAFSINRVKDTGKSIGLVVGGSMGLDQNVLKICTQKISFSKMIFPHQLFRIMLLEQLYRAFCILEGIPYHKA